MEILEISWILFKNSPRVRLLEIFDFLEARRTQFSKNRETEIIRQKRIFSRSRFLLSVSRIAGGRRRGFCRPSRKMETGSGDARRFNR